MSLAQESLKALSESIASIALMVTNQGLSARDALRIYGVRMLFEILRTVEEKSLDGQDQGKDKKQAATDLALHFFDTVVGPRMNLFYRTMARQVYSLVIGYLIDSAVSYVNRKFDGKFESV